MDPQQLARRPLTSGARSPLLQPAAEAVLALSAPAACQQSLGPDVLVEFGPLDGIAAADQDSVGSFLGRSVSEAWVPRQRHGEGTAIREANRQVGLGDLDRSGRGLRFKAPKKPCQASSRAVAFSVGRRKIRLIS